MTTDGPTAGDQEVIVMLQLYFKPGAIDRVVRELVPIVRLTREETGNIDFQVLRANDDDDRLVLIERWADRAALEEHWRQDYTQRVLALFEETLVLPLSHTKDVTYLSDMMRAAG